MAENFKFYSYPYTGDGSEDKNDLIHNGAYYFKIQFAPNYSIQNSGLGGFINVGDREALSLDARNAIAKLSEKIANEFKNPNNALIAYTQTTAFQTQVVNQLKATTNAIAAKYTSQLQNVLGEGTTKEFNYEALYKEQDMEEAIVFLPLNSMRIERVSGVAQTQGAYGSVKQTLASKARSEMEEATSTKGVIVSRGLSENPYLGFTMTGTDFEKYNLEWDLLPRNETEMGQIIKIITYFQGACLSNLNINEKQNGKWILPPVAEMGMLVTSLTESDDENIQQLIDARNQDFSNNQKDKTLKESLGKSTISNVRTFWLKPPVQVFVSSITIEPLENKGGVLLSPEGFPMGIKLNVQLMRCALSTVQDMFRSDNRSTKSTKDTSMDRANPFA